MCGAALDSVTEVVVSVSLLITCAPPAHVNTPQSAASRAEAASCCLSLSGGEPALSLTLYLPTEHPACLIATNLDRTNYSLLFIDYFNICTFGDDQ